jgi:hypothetical protein
MVQDLGQEVLVVIDQPQLIETAAMDQRASSL